MTESRNLVREAMSMAFGCYVEQEATKGDSWRDQDPWQLISHASHEVEELRRSDSPTLLVHNGMDLCNLGAMMVAKELAARRKAEKYTPEK